MLNFLVLNITGILVPTLEQLMLDAVAAHGDIANDREFRHRVYGCCREYRLGEFSSIELGNRVVNQSALKIDPVQFGQGLQDQFNFNCDVIGVLEMIRDRFEFLFISDLPQLWIGSRLEQQSIQSKFNAQVSYNEELQNQHSAASILKLSLAAAKQPVDQLLLIDRRNQVTSLAVRSGINAILFVNSFRLQQELTLRKLL